ncbi:MAG: dTDP-4-dehydrorhamnose 3,5-epimerase [Oscillospiraceae bacterium]|nr:dTDP-4-dehydrorhamnose 3,5-epimerase [Oscillospiraceae bacterium]
MINQNKVVILNGIDIFSDHRGYTSVSFENASLREQGINFNVAQVDQGYSYKANTLRGLHYQKAPYEQAKLVSCLHGSIYSVGVDIRKESATFGQYVGEILSFENRKIMYIPKGFAHGYLTLEDDVLMQWCCDGNFNKDAACALRYDDPDIGIEWPKIAGDIIISDKDRNARLLRDIE